MVTRNKPGSLPNEMLDGSKRYVDPPRGMSGVAVESIAGFWVPQGSLHHIGFAVASIRAAVEGFAESIEAEWDGEIIHDPNQAACVAFLRGKNAADPLVELVEPAGEKSPLRSFLKKGGGLHHLCYEVDSLDKQLEVSRSQGGLISRQPFPAVAFGGRRIAWVYTKNRLLLEYLERGKTL